VIPSRRVGFLQRVREDLVGFWETWVAQPALALTTLLALSAAFFLMILTTHLALNLKGLLAGWGTQIQATIYLDQDAGPEIAEHVKEQLLSNPRVGAVEIVTPERATEIFRAQMASYAPGLLSDPDLGNPFPTSLEVSLREAGDVDALPAMTEVWRSWAHVEDITSGKNWIENYRVVVNAVSWFAWTLAGSTLVGCILIIGNSLRSATARRREEIELMELLGSSPFDIRRPLLVEGSLLALIGGLAGLGLNVALQLAQFQYIRQSVFLSRVLEDLQGIGLAHALVWVAISISIGFGAALIVARRLNSGWAASQRLASQ
jgi:cell division transport system permease protein